jgi:hypothetical protein
VTSLERGGNVNNDVRADDRLDKVAAELIGRGLHVRVAIEGDLSPDDPDADSILIHNPVSGQYAQVGYVSSGPDVGDVVLELTYQTAQAEDPDGAHMAGRVARLLSASAIPDRM